MIRFLLIAILTIALTPLPSFAAEINDEGAKRLQSTITELINGQKGKIEARQGTLIAEGNITIEQAESYYAVTLPSYTLTKADGSNIKIGLIAINAVPTDNSDNWKLSIALPSPFNYLDKDGNFLRKIDIGSQRMGGLWNGQLKTFTALSLYYGGIKITSSDNTPEITIDQLKLQTALEKEDLNDSWGVKKDIKIRGLHLNNPSINEFIPSTINLNTTLDNIPLTQVADIIKNLTAQSGNANGQKIQTLGAMMTLPQILAEAGTTFNLTNTNISNTLYDIKANSSFKADPQSAIGVTGELNLNIDGLNKIERALKIRRKNATEKVQQEINQTIKKLDALKTISTEENGRHSMKLTLDKDAQIQINGQDISGLIDAD